MGRVNRWSGVAEAYRVSFAPLCAGTLPRLLADAAPGRLLDVGCGAGDLVRLALDAGRDAVGADLDPEMVAMTDALGPGRAVLAALPALPWADGAFGAVVANFVVNHVPDPRAAVAELARVAAPGAASP